LRGRAGRQGDGGSSQFYVSMEDDLMRIFGGERIKNMMDILKLPQGMPVENRLISRSLESAQKRVEGYNFDMRKHLVEYDDVMNKHRDTIYRKRKKAMISTNLKDEILKVIWADIERICQLHAAEAKDNWNIKEIIESVKAILGSGLEADLKQKTAQIEMQQELIDFLCDLVKKIYSAREEKIGSKLMRQVEKTIFLRTIDTLWLEHLTQMEELRQGISLRGIGQRDPLVEYKREAYNMFERLLAAIDSQVAGIIFKVEVTQQPPAAASLSPVDSGQVVMKGASEQAAAGTFSNFESRPTSPADSGSAVSGKSTLMEKETADRSQSVNKFAGVGRNDPCPCGSGKKFKKCHGKFK